MLYSMRSYDLLVLQGIPADADADAVIKMLSNKFGDTFAILIRLSNSYHTSDAC